MTETVCTREWVRFDGVTRKSRYALLGSAYLLLHGDPYGNRTHVTAVKGPCLNRLTNGPGSGDWT